MDKTTEKADLSFIEAIKTMGQSIKLSWHISKKSVIIYHIGTVLNVAGIILSTYAAARVIGFLFSALQNSNLKTSVWLWLGVTLFGQLLTTTGNWMQDYNRRLLYTLVNVWSTDAFYEQISRIDINDFYNPSSRNTINKLKNGFSFRSGECVYKSHVVIAETFKTMAIIFTIGTAAWWIAPLLIIFLIPSLLVESVVAKFAWGIWTTRGDEKQVVWSLDTIVSQPDSQLEVRALQSKNKIIQINHQIQSKFQKEMHKIIKENNGRTIIALFGEVVGVAIIEIWLIFRVLYQNSLSVSSYVFYAGIITRLYGSLSMVFSSYSGMQEDLLYSKDFFEFTNKEPTISSPKDAIKLDNKLPKIEFENVSFKYPEGDKNVFENLSFTIEPGEHIALVGENGAGKTTLIKLLLRFYDVDEGAIKINGVDIKQIDLDTWYSQLGTLFQDFNRYPFSIEENITIGGETKKIDKLKSVIQESGVDEIADKLPHGLDTILDSSFEKGVEPSGGQWQRVAIARAFYRDANILILDEPTAAIDSKAEYKIFNSIFDHQAEKGAIIISHRFSTVRRADRILVVSKGKIIQDGNHDELIKQTDGLYHDMFEKQAEGYR